MEKQVHQRRHGALKKVSLSVGIAVAVALGSSTNVRAAFMADAASEHTQILNNIELVMSYITQVQNAINTYNTYRQTFETVKNLEKQFETLDEDALAGMSDGVISKIARLGNLSRQMQRTMESGQRAVGVLERTVAGASAADMSIEDYVEARAILAERNKDMYHASYEQDVQRMQDFQAQASQLREMASSAADITSHIQGFQEVVAATVRVEAQMASLNGAISRLNVMIARQGEVAAIEAQYTAKRMDKSVAYGKSIAEQDIIVPSPFRYGASGDSYDDGPLDGDGTEGDDTRPPRPPRPPIP